MASIRAALAGGAILCIGVGAAACASREPDAASRSAWDFLAAKYDKDSDGRVSSAEYDRGATAFGRLDRDHDGFLCASDFVRPPRSPGAAGERDEIQRDVARGLLVKCFQDDAGGDFSRGQLARSFAAMDASADGRVTRDEFDADLARRDMTRTKIMGMDRFDTLVHAMAEPRGDTLALSGLDALFVSLDANGDGTLSGAEIPDLGRVARHPRPHEAESNAVAAAGKIAPDFDLTTANGDARVKLSSFAGARPVALIFGSFT